MDLCLRIWTKLIEWELGILLRDCKGVSICDNNTQLAISVLKNVEKELFGDRATILNIKCIRSFVYQAKDTQYIRVQQTNHLSFVVMWSLCKALHSKRDPIRLIKG